jgi:hypothetical protein
MTADQKPVYLSGLALNPNASLETRRIGRDRQPVLIVDGALVDADAMVGFACAHTSFNPPAPPSQYPGRIARLPANYVRDVLGGLRLALADLFGFRKDPRPFASGFYGLTTLPQAAMAPEQVIPHADAVRPDAYATVHFLNAADYGGTAFYRHKATGLEVVTPLNSEACHQIRNAELEAHKGQGHGALQALYEEIAYIEPVFNRLILYRASQLHSARLADVDDLPDDPRTGRLTANLFVNIG